MRNFVLKYFYILILGFILIIVGAALYPTKQNQLEFIEQRIDDIQNQREVLTEKERELEKLATEKEWQEVDDIENNCTDDGCPSFNKDK
tara:strand:+ start:142 stop:408 length:267 start_codon:yes stop_codon:yes gene_type:complete